MIVSQASDIDMSKQLIFTKVKYEKYDKQQNLLSTEFSEWMTRYNDLPSYKKLFEKCGLMIEEVVGSYKNEPVSEK
ncbi:hypothetical protein LCGC14_0976910 [marine sediment metagenome]|uniref:Uncharacterized protein n=1 Tax=marine sediment metagenome TaxID=412755 RepID=A0A0F9NW93_9ZZZZ